MPGLAGFSGVPDGLVVGLAGSSGVPRGLVVGLAGFSDYGCGMRRGLKKALLPCWVRLVPTRTIVSYIWPCRLTGEMRVAVCLHHFGVLVRNAFLMSVAVVLEYSF